MEETKETKEEADNIYDVIIVGAGFAGLSAALYFKDCNINNILVLEANNRIGGRVETEYITINNEQRGVDMGAGYVGYGQNRTLKMAQRFNIEKYPIYGEGNLILNNSGNIQIMDNTMGIIKNIWNFIDMNYVIQKLNKLISDFDENNYEIFKKYKNYDSITFKSWIESIISHNTFVQNFFKAQMEVQACRTSSQISMLYIIKFLKQGGSFEATMQEAQNHKFKTGFYSIIDGMIKEINKNGQDDKIRINHPVQGINYDDDEYVIVRCNNDKIFKCKYIMVCIPTNKYKSIQFEPPLSWERLSVTNQMIQAHVIKVTIFYKTPFWREKGLNVAFNCGQDKNNEFPMIFAGDNTKPDMKFPSIVGIIAGNKAIEFTVNYTKEERRNIILKQYAKLYDDEKAINECIGYMEKIWHKEKYIGGGYSAIPVMDTLSQIHYNKIFEPEGERVYFACTELAKKWDSYVDGAIGRGQREANKIAKLLEKKLDDDDNEIKVVQFYENEPEPEDNGVKYVDHSAGWVQKNLPNSRQMKICILIAILLVIGIIILFSV